MGSPPPPGKMIEPPGTQTKDKGTGGKEEPSPSTTTDKNKGRGSTPNAICEKDHSCEYNKNMTATYMRRVHGLDYYGMIELKEPPKGLRHVRAESKNNHDDKSIVAAEWEKTLDSTWKDRLQGKHRHEHTHK